MNDSTDTAIRPFKLDIPQADLDDLRDRSTALAGPTSSPATSTTASSSRTSDRSTTTGGITYDWRATEARINAHPQFTTEIDGQNVHFLHVRSPEPNALPLIVTHGWPGSILEFFDIIGPLTDPRAHGGDPADAFDLVIPSMPGYGLSGPTRERGWNNYRIAAAWVELMRRLGYERYGAVGQRRRLDDLAGGRPARPRGRRRRPRHPALLVPVGRPVRVRGHDRGGDDRARDAPVVLREQDVLQQGLLRAAADGGIRHHRLAAGAARLECPALGEDLDADFQLSNVMLYWLTGTAGSAGRLYYENAHAVDRPTEPTTVPIGLAGFGGDFSGIRRFAERDHNNIVSWNMYPSGGHFAAHKAPNELIGDIRAFFARFAEASAGREDRFAGPPVTISRMVDWNDFAREAPRIAEVFVRRHKATGNLCFLATLRSDGSPRISPMEPRILEGRLVARRHAEHDEVPRPGSRPAVLPAHGHGRYAPRRR